MDELTLKEAKDTHLCKEAIHKRLHIIVHLYKISRKGKTIDRKQINGCLGLELE